MNYENIETSVREMMNVSVRNIAEKQCVLRQRLDGCTNPDEKFAKSRLYANKCQEQLARDAEEIKASHKDIKLHILKQKKIRLSSTKLTSKNDGLLCGVEGLEEFISKEQENIKSHRKALEKRQELIMEALSPLRSDNDQYRRFLGLDITPTKENTLMFSFKHISRKNPDKVYTFQLDIKDNLYNVTQCDPPLPVINETLLELNTDDNFIRFVVEMRKQMVAFVEDEIV